MVSFFLGLLEVLKATETELPQALVPTLQPPNPPPVRDSSKSWMNVTGCVETPG